MFDGDWVGAAFGFENGARFEEVLDAGDVERGGHNNDEQIGTCGFLDLEGAGECDVAVEVSLVKFVEDDGVDACELRIVEHLAEENALSDVPDARARRGDIVETDLVTDFLAELCVAILGNPRGEHSSWQPAWLEDDDLTVSETATVKEHLGDLGGLAGASGGGDDEAALRCRSGEQRVSEFKYGQVAHVWVCYTPIMQKLAREFYDRDTVVVARELLGKCLVHGGRVGRIVETEAYVGAHDLASHSCRGRTARNAPMFGPPGIAYVYMIYGMYFCMNVVTEPEGHASAVLVRALEPVKGLTGKTSGPGLLCNAMGIDKRLNGHDLLSEDFYIGDTGVDAGMRIVKRPRIGVDYAGAWARRHLRFYIKGNPFVSRK